MVKVDENMARSQTVPSYDELHIEIVGKLKKTGIPLNTQTVMKYHPDVYWVHFTATDIELNYAVSKKDDDWVKARINLAPSWLEDDMMPKHLVPRCRALMEKFSCIP